MNPQPSRHVTSQSASQIVLLIDRYRWITRRATTIAPRNFNLHSTFAIVIGDQCMISFWCANMPLLPLFITITDGHKFCIDNNEKKRSVDALFFKTDGSTNKRLQNPNFKPLFISQQLMNAVFVCFIN